MSEWKNLNEVQLVSPIHSKKNRDMWRETFSLKKIKVLLSKRELENAGQAANPVSDAEDFNDEVSSSEEEIDGLDGSEDSF